MTQIVVFMVFGDLDLDLWPIFTKKNVELAGYAESTVTRIILIGTKLWPVGGVTDKQMKSTRRVRTLRNFKI